MTDYIVLNLDSSWNLTSRNRKKKALKLDLVKYIMGVNEEVA
jgi:hypothetical protein